MTTQAVDEKKAFGTEVPVSDRTSSSSNDSNNGDLEKATPEYGSYSDHIFANEDVADYWRAVYEKSQYEGRHQFDPKLEWTAAEEIRIRKKVRRVPLPLLSLN